MLLVSYQIEPVTKAMEKTENIALIIMLAFFAIAITLGVMGFRWYQKKSESDRNYADQRKKEEREYRDKKEQQQYQRRKEENDEKRAATGKILEKFDKLDGTMVEGFKEFEKRHNELHERVNGLTYRVDRLEEHRRDANGDKI